MNRIPQTLRGVPAAQVLNIEAVGASLIEGGAGKPSELFSPEVPCPECEGTRYFVEGDQEFPCQRCRATGWVVKGSRAPYEVCNHLDDSALPSYVVGLDDEFSAEGL